MRRFYAITSLAKELGYCPVIILSLVEGLDPQEVLRNYLSDALGRPITHHLIVATWDGDQKEWLEVQKAKHILKLIHTR